MELEAGPKPESSPGVNRVCRACAAMRHPRDTSPAVLSTGRATWTFAQ